MKADLLSKLLQVIEQIPQDVLYDFCCSYAQEHEELAMALVNEFWGNRGTGTCFIRIGTSIILYL